MTAPRWLDRLLDVAALRLRIADLEQRLADVRREAAATRRLADDYRRQRDEAAEVADRAAARLELLEDRAHRDRLVRVVEREQRDRDGAS